MGKSVGSGGVERTIMRCLHRFMRVPGRLLGGGGVNTIPMGGAKQGARAGGRLGVKHLRRVTLWERMTDY